MQHFVSENLALNLDFKGIPTQSTSYIDDYHAENAVNGKFNEEGDKSACSFTVANPPRWRAWWKLPLKKLSNVAYLQIHFRESSTFLCLKIIYQRGFIPICNAFNWYQATKVGYSFLYNLDNQVFSLEIVDIQFFDIIKIHWPQHRTDFNDSFLWVHIDQLYTKRVLKLLA